MADLLQSERLQPCLLDRFTDDDPGSQKEGRDERVISMRDYRSAVLRDLVWLLNTSNIESVEDLTEYPEVEESVVNYGMPDFCGMTASGVDPSEVEGLIGKAIKHFEPRILASSLVVRAVTAPDQEEGHTLGFEIEGELWAQPMHESLFIKTELDLDTGSVTVKERGR